MKKHKSKVLHIFISFCFGDDNSEFDGKCGVNGIGNGSSDVYHHLFYESNETIVAIIYFSFFI